MATIRDIIWTSCGQDRYATRGGGTIALVVVGLATVVPDLIQGETLTTLDCRHRVLCRHVGARCRDERHPKDHRRQEG